MQRVKHADTRLKTRRRLELGEAVEAAGADHLSRNEIIKALCQFMGKGMNDIPNSPYLMPKGAGETETIILATSEIKTKSKTAGA